MIINIYDYSGRMKARELSIRKLVSHIVGSEGAHMTALNIIVTDDAHMRDLNKRFLNNDRPTNVIAFPLGEMNEIYVSRDQARTEEELCYFIAHGLLHLLGYEHESRRDDAVMDDRCREYLNAVLPDRTGEATS